MQRLDMSVMQWTRGRTRDHGWESSSTHQGMRYFTLITISRKTFFTLSIMIKVALLLFGCVNQVASVRKNVLFFAVDDLRVQLGGEGNAIANSPTMHTPNLDKLIGKGLFLRKAQVQQAVCSPTRTSILTSRYPDTTRVWDLFSYFRDVGGNFTTIPELFRLHGYVTTGMGKIFHPGHASGAQSENCVGCSKGDDQVHSWTRPSYHPPNLGYWSGKIRQPNCTYCGNSWINVGPADAAAMPLPDTQTAEFAVNTLNGFGADGTGSSGSGGNNSNFFVAVGFHKPHLPFVAPSAFFDMYPDVDAIELPADQEPPTGMPPVAWSNWGEMRAYLDIAALNNTGNPGDILPATVVKQLRRAYYASVSFTDYNVGLVMDALQSNGLAENTVVSFWGDHGWQLGEHGEWCKHTNFDLATNAPMFIVVPGLTDGGIITHTPTEYVDLMPTLAELAMDYIVPSCPEGNTSTVQLCTHGVSLVPLITDPLTPIRKAAYSQYPRGWNFQPKAQTTKFSSPVATGVELEMDSKVVYDNLQKVSPPSECLTKKCTMGYSLLTVVNGIEYRYTEWAAFNTVRFGKPDWTQLAGRELYNHSSDPLENVNIATKAGSTPLEQSLSALLKEHPTTK